MVMPALPPPDWLAVIPREDIAAEMRADMPGVSFRDTDPASVWVESAASDIYNAILFFNAYSVGAMPQYAVDSLLDAWGRVNGLLRNESPNDAFRYEIFTEPDNWSRVRGNRGKAIAAQSVDGVDQAQVVSNYVAGRADVYILSTRAASQTGGAIGVPSSTLRDAVKSRLNAGEVESYFSIDAPPPTVRSYTVGFTVEYAAGSVASDVRSAVNAAAIRFGDDYRRLSGDVLSNRFSSAIYAASDSVEMVSIEQFQATDFDGTNPVGDSVGNLYATQNRAAPSDANPRAMSIAYSMREPPSLTLRESP